MNRIFKGHRWFTACLVQCMAFLVSPEVHADSVSPFKLASHLVPDNYIEVKKNFFSNDSITTFPEGQSIYGLDIDGQVILNEDNGTVRIVLEDVEGTEYLVAEIYRMFVDSDTVMLNHYCEETFELFSVIPKKLNIYVSDASLYIEKFSFPTSGSIARTYSLPDESTDQRRLQIQHRVDAINDYNVKHNKLWRAGMTEMSLLPYNSKKKIYGYGSEGCFTNGLEYYVGGIFEMGSPQAATATASTSSFSHSMTPTPNFIPEFDWRDRHGKNWLTPCAHQGESGYCWAFAAVGATEAMVNLYYNDTLNWNLSEKDVGYYTYSTNANGYDGGHIYDALKYIRDNGVIDESSLPFTDDSTEHLSKERTTIYNECVRISGYERVLSYVNSQEAIATIKRMLFTRGPLVSGTQWYPPGNTYSYKGHAMPLVGYGELCAGDTIWWYKEEDARGNVVVPSNHELVGATYWIFKNSYGYDLTSDGYLQVVFWDDCCWLSPYAINTPIISLSQTVSDVRCTDEDGDGFYFWGLGTRPAHCPSWAPELCDGDDSDYTAGPMNEYGYCITINPNGTDSIFAPIHIQEDTVWDTYEYYHQHVYVENSSSLTVTSDTDFYRGATIYLENGTTLVVDGVVLDNVKIEAESGSKIIIKNNGKVNYCPNSNFSLPLGAELEIIHGTIN